MFAGIRCMVGCHNLKRDEHATLIKKAPMRQYKEPSAVPKRLCKYSAALLLSTLGRCHLLGDCIIMQGTARRYAPPGELPCVPPGTAAGLRFRCPGWYAAILPCSTALCSRGPQEFNDLIGLEERIRTEERLTQRDAADKPHVKVRAPVKELQ